MPDLIICEKPSVAKTVSAVLNAKERGDGFFHGSGYIVSWCVGHLLELAAPDAYGEQYVKWRYTDLPILPQAWLHKPSKGKTEQLKTLKELMARSDVDCVINACDAGREGELIFRLVYNHAKCKKPIKRLWISSMEDTAIRDGFEHLKDGAEYDTLYAAASCREQADWLVGINATRLFSVLYGVTLNTGRVQSPTLAMLVRRELDIATFVKEPFFTPTLDLDGFTASGDKLRDRAAADTIAAACDGQNATVTAIDRVQKTAAPPKLYDLTTLQRDANRLLGYTAQQTLDYVQALYEKKLVSYPRTDARHITADMSGTMLSILGELDFEPDIQRLVGKVSDHHAIIPTQESRAADIAALPSGEREVFALVRKRLVAAVSPKHVYEAVTVTIKCGEYDFTAKGKTVITAGWTSVTLDPISATGGDEKEGSSPLPELLKGQIFENVTATAKEGATTPPKHFTEDLLLSAMETAGSDDMPDDAERKGLGTPATRAGVIEKLVKSGFVERSKKNLLPTDKGRKLIAVLPDTLTSPMLTAEWEHKLSQVEHGELSGEAFMDGIAMFTKSIVTENAAPRPEFQSLFPQASAQTGDAIGNCPRCGSPVREGAKGFFCDGSDCGFKLWKASKFWTDRKKPLTAAHVKALLKDGRVAVKGLHSEKTGKKYDAIIILDDTGGQYVNFKMDFNTGRVKK